HGESIRARMDGDDYLRFDGPSGTARAIATGRAFAVADLASSPDVSRRMVDHSPAASALFVPGAWDGAVRRGVLAGSSALHPLTADTVELAELLAVQAASGYARIEAAERRAAGAAQDKAVVRAGRALNESLDLQEVLLTLAREVAQALDADSAGVYLGD